MLDIIEIDGASNNGVENVRDLIEKARFEPSQGKYKIYIIDEVHMLSTGAFNALLKTLEEPPPHVKFILATTEIEKVPETIRSRSLRFDFRKITETDIIARLEYVVGAEKITAEKEALQIIAQAARGAMRDALTLLEQHTVSGIVSTEYVRSSLSLLEESMIHEIIESLTKGDSTRIREIIVILASRHIQVRALFDQLLYALRDRMVAHIDDSEFSLYSDIMRVIEDAYTRVRAIPDGMLLIEVTLLRAVMRES
jgi:DNA polymerase III subunit gamma/tau